MAIEIFWSRLAEKKLRDIFDYYRMEAGAKTARKIVAEIVKSTINLGRNPNIGPLEELLSDRPQKFRYLVVKNYKIIYYNNLESNRIVIANVFDARQNPEKILET